MQLRVAYWQAVAPSVVAGVWAVVFTKIAQVTVGLVRLTFVIVALHPPPFTVGPPSVLPTVTQKFTVPAVGGTVHEWVLLYLTESAKYASSAVARFRRSDFIEVMYGFALVLVTFGIGWAARSRDTYHVILVLAISRSSAGIMRNFDGTGYPDRLVHGSSTPCSAWVRQTCAGDERLGRARVAPMHVWRARHATGASLPCHPA